MAESGKALRAMMAVFLNDPMSLDFVKLAKASNTFRAAVERNFTTRLIFAAEQSPDPESEFCKIADERMLDWAYEHRHFMFAGLARLKKSRNPFSFFNTHERYVLVTGVGVVETRFFVERQRRYFACFWRAGNYAAFKWAARNFVGEPNTPLFLMNMAIRTDRDSEVEEIYNSYPNACRLWNCDDVVRLVLEASLIEDKIEIAKWIRNVTGCAGVPFRVFEALVMLNNLAALKWLIETTNTNPRFVRYMLTFGSGCMYTIAENALWLMRHNRRQALANFFSEYTEIEPVSPRENTLLPNLSFLVVPPPPTKRLSRLSPDYKRRLEDAKKAWPFEDCSTGRKTQSYFDPTRAESKAYF